MFENSGKCYTLIIPEACLVKDEIKLLILTALYHQFYMRLKYIINFMPYAGLNGLILYW